MQPARVVHIGVFLAFLVAMPALAASQQAADPQALRQEIDQLRTEFETLRQHYEARLSALEARLASVPGGAGTPTDAPQQPVPPATPDVGGGGGNVFNPDTSVIANFAGAGGRNALSDQPSLSLSEVEVAFQSVVDPYARADVFLSATPDGLEVEEGYITFTALPAGVLLKAGQMRAQFGKVNTMHTHILPWADRPLVSQNLIGGEEGLADSGISVSKLIPNGFMFLDAIGEVYRGNSDVFQSDRRSRLNYVGRLRGYRDLTEGTNLDVGVSYAHGPSAAFPDLTKQLTGIDATFRYRPLRRAIYRQFVGRTELIWSRQDVPAGTQQQAFGFYGSVDYQFARRWFVGVRGDRSGRVLDSALHDSGGSLALTFRPTDFSLIRGQYRRTRYAEGMTANELGWFPVDSNDGTDLSREFRWPPVHDGRRGRRDYQLSVRGGSQSEPQLRRANHLYPNAP